MHVPFDSARWRRSLGTIIVIAALCCSGGRWRDDRITAQAVRIFVPEPLVLSTQYVLTNHTNDDYVLDLSADRKVFLKDFRGLVAFHTAGTRLEGRAIDPRVVTLPPGERIALTVSAIYLVRPG